ncbi:MAG: TerB family tellurite resistance protein [Alphaproteobacteria bacterium]|nr:TerB family tellurite resistance protein [Alphaproteobacteria bacterium]
MHRIMDNAFDLDAPATRTIAAAMRQISRVDGAHPKEDALIDELEASIPGGAAAKVDLSTLTTDEARVAFLRSTVLVAFADGTLTHAERAILQQWTDELGLDEAALHDAVEHVATVLLSRFEGVKIYRDQVEAIGRGLGLDAGRIAAILG